MNEITTAIPGLSSAEQATVPDMQLAKALGYERPRAFRQLIKRHLPALEQSGLVLQRVAPIISGKGRVSSVTEYHLNRAQAYFIINKAGTKLADSLAIRLAEVAALYDAGGLVVTDANAQAALAAIETRNAERYRLHLEEREARDSGLKLLSIGRTRRKKTAAQKMAEASARWQRKYGDPRNG